MRLARLIVFFDYSSDSILTVTDVESRTVAVPVGVHRLDDVEYVGLLGLDLLEYPTDGRLLPFVVGRRVGRYVIEQVGRRRRVFEVLVDGGS